MYWEQIDIELPRGIIVFSGENKTIPLKAWVAKVDYSNRDNKIAILSSTDSDHKETPEQFAKRTNAIIVINAGYFLTETQSARHVGLLKIDGLLKEPASHTVYRDNSQYYVSRGAFGIDSFGTVDIAWASTRNDTIFVWDEVIQNRPGKPILSLDFAKGKPWNMSEAVHAGPVLITDGKINITTEEEVFFNTPIAGVQPRSAIGYTKNGELIIMVVDGRQADSRGVYLEELALLMSQFHCLEAMNLDGGGSSAMVLNRELINRPSGLFLQREVMSAIGVYHQE